MNSFKITFELGFLGIVEYRVILILKCNLNLMIKFIGTNMKKQKWKHMQKGKKDNIRLFYYSKNSLKIFIF